MGEGGPPRRRGAGEGRDQGAAMPTLISQTNHTITKRQFVGRKYRTATGVRPSPGSEAIRPLPEMGEGCSTSAIFMPGPYILSQFAPTQNPVDLAPCF